MGYRGRIADQERARALRARAWTLQAIADEVGASRGQVSVWVRHVDFLPVTRSSARRRQPNALQQRKQAEIDALRADGLARIGELSRKELLVAGTALYAGEGSKRDGMVQFTNSDARMVRLFVTWLRTFFAIDESRLRIRLYLHEGLDLNAAERFWSAVANVPVAQFTRPYRAAADPSIRSNKHLTGCCSVVYTSARTHRAIMGLVDALLSSPACLPG